MLDKPSLLIKFGSKENLESLQKHGIVHCKSIKWFAEYEDGNVRGDEFEAVTKTVFLKDTFIHLKEAENPASEWKKLRITTGLFKEYYKEPLGNLFCMSKFDIHIPLNE
jgi:hypothetical protein